MSFFGVVWCGVFVFVCGGGGGGVVGWVPSPEWTQLSSFFLLELGLCFWAGLQELAVG